MEEHGYPKAVFFIIGNEFCERFSFFGLRGMLSDEELLFLLYIVVSYISCYICYEPTVLTKCDIIHSDSKNWNPAIFSNVFKNSGQC